MTVWGANRRIKMKGIVDRFEGEIILIEIDGLCRIFQRQLLSLVFKLGIL
jgi:hypothetical protein